MNVHAQTDSEAETRALAARLGGWLRGGDCVALDGPLGCGKTCFVRGLAEGLDLDPAAVSSPTFVIHHEYTGRGSGVRQPGCLPNGRARPHPAAAEPVGHARL